MADEVELSIDSAVRVIVETDFAGADRIDRRVLLQMWQHVTGLSESQSRHAFAVCEDSFRAAISSIDQFSAGEGLHVGLGGWSVRLNDGLVQGALIAAILPGILALAKCPDIPSALWPTVLPILLVVERCRVSKSDDKVLAVLKRQPGVVDVSLPISNLYEKLPIEIQDMLSYLDFVDVVESLRRAGEADSAGNCIKIRSQAAGFRVTFE